MRSLLVAAALAAAAIVGCATTSLVPETGRYAEGQRIYREHCGSCHRLRDPREQTRDRWAWAVKKYGNRAHLAPEDRPAVLDYLQARAKDAPPPEPPAVAAPAPTPPPAPAPETR